MHFRPLSRLLLLQHRTNATNAAVASPARLASEFNGLVIPSHQDLQLRQDLTKNRTYSSATDIAARRHDSTIEERRAARLTREAAQRRDPNVEQPRAARPAREVAQIHDSTVEQRRAARLAREATQQQRETSLNRASRPGLPHREGVTGQYRGRPTTTRTGAIKHDRFGGLDALGEFRVRTSLTTAKSRDRRGLPQNRSESSRVSHTAKTRARSRRSNNGRVVVKRPSTDEGATSKEDISFSVVEEGGEEPCGAEVTAPESLSVDLADVFRPRRAKSELVRARKHQPAELNAPCPIKDRIKYILEAFGGDYSRYVPQTAQDCITTPEKIDAAKQAQLALSKNKAIDLNQRETLVKLVTASTAV